jgi:hypothetical protein
MTMLVLVSLIATDVDIVISGCGGDFCALFHISGLLISDFGLAPEARLLDFALRRRRGGAFFPLAN